jgi:vacuolar-type H+-ATPase subunit H
MGVGSFFKNLFGSKKVEEVVDQIEEFADNAIDKARESAAPLMEKVEDFAEQAGAKVKEYIPQAEEAIGNVVETIKEKAGVLMDKAEDFAHSTVDSVKGKAEDVVNETPEAPKPE